MNAIAAAVKVVPWLTVAVLASEFCVVHAAGDLPRETRVETVALIGERDTGDISVSIASIGDGPRHEISQRVYSYTVSSPDFRDFDGATTMNFAQSDSSGDRGTHSGYAIWTLKSGDTVKLRFSGTHQTLAAGAKEAPTKGEFEFTGGSGKYQRIKGHSTYEGKTTATGGRWKAVVTIEY